MSATSERLRALADLVEGLDVEIEWRWGTVTGPDAKTFMEWHLNCPEPQWSVNQRHWRIHRDGLHFEWVEFKPGGMKKMEHQ